MATAVKSMRRCALVLAALLVLTGPVCGQLQFQFDYQYDSYGFFNDPARREALEAAGRLVNYYVDDLDAIIPEGSNGWDSYFTKPDGTGSIILSDLPVPENTMQIFVAGRSLPGLLAQSIDTAPLGRGTPAWKATVADRGQAGAALTPATDLGPMGGSISFNSDTSEIVWDYGLSTAGLDPHEFDFITVAVHEIIHLLGFGISRSFNGQINQQGRFVGKNSVAVGSTTNPTLQLDEYEAHWKSGTKSPWNGGQQEALLAPGIYPGRRAFPTLLDRAALRDIGWEEASAGDANRDRLFDSDDFVDVFQQGKYETGDLASWGEGDWNDDALFTSDDLVTAMQTGTYEQGMQRAIRTADVLTVPTGGTSDPAAARAVPEPSAILICLLGASALLAARRRV